MSDFKNTEVEVDVEVEVETDDENTLVTAEDLTETAEVPKIESKWDNPELLEKLSKEMESLEKIRFDKIEFTEAILTKAMADVFKDLGWNSYQNFRNTVNGILQYRHYRDGPSNRIPFSLKTRNQRTGKMDFWLVRSFVNVGGDRVYSDDEGNSISKKTVLMSRQFTNFLRGYCRKVLKDEVQFWSFTGSFKGKQHLDINKLIQEDIDMLPLYAGDSDPNNLVMIQFKMKTAEVIIGAKPRANKVTDSAAVDKKPTMADRIKDAQNEASVGE